MDPQKIPFNALIVGPTNSGKTQFLVNQLCVPFSGKFDYIVLVCPTFIGISVWVLTQKLTGITASFRENVAAIVLFYTPSAKTTKAIFDDYVGELSMEEYKNLISKLKERKFSHLVFSL